MLLKDPTLLDTLRNNRDLLPVQEVLTRLAPQVAQVSDTLDRPQRPQLGIMDGSLAPGDAFYFLPRDAGTSRAL